MIKFFTTRFGTNPEIDEQLLKLRKEFPGYYFSAGKRKDASGIYVIKDLNIKNYSEPLVMNNGDSYWGPVAPLVSLSAFRSGFQERITITLHCGLPVEIFPASCEPRKVMISMRKIQVADTANDIYNKNSAYGLLAYELYEAAQKPDSKISLSDPKYLDFVAKALEVSYHLPSCFWDDYVNTNDLDSIFSAAMGIDPKEILSESRKKSTSVTA